MPLQKQKVLDRYKEAEETLFSKNLSCFPEVPGKVLKISSTYAGVWLEHAYDALVFSTLYPKEKSVALSQASCFFQYQTADGRLPSHIRDISAKENRGRDMVNYGQTQEVISFGDICFETYRLTGDREFLKTAYGGLKKWDEWLKAYRMTRNTGLVETFCEYDTGHDNALRVADLEKSTPDPFGKTFKNSDFMPLITPDMNAVLYGDRLALSRMAAELGLSAEAEHYQKSAEDVRRKMFALLYDGDDQFFYDLDNLGRKRKFKTVAMTVVFGEKLLKKDEFDTIYERYFKNEEEFFTKISFAATAKSDPHFIKNAAGNSWNYYAEALVALRAERWMNHYGRQKDYEELLYRWVKAYCASPLPFGQEFDPLTGEPSDCSPYYSSAMLFYIRAVRRLGFL